MLYVSNNHCPVYMACAYAWSA